MEAGTPLPDDLSLSLPLSGATMHIQMAGSRGSPGIFVRLGLLHLDRLPVESSLVHSRQHRRNRALVPTVLGPEPLLQFRLLHANHHSSRDDGKSGQTQIGRASCRETVELSERPVLW